jgi:cytochrome c6
LNPSSIRLVMISFLAIAVFSLSAAPARAQGGADLYKAKCAACHGPDGKGTTPAGVKLGAHDFSSPDVQKQSDPELIDVVTKGKKKMPAYEKTLKPDEIKSLVAYVRELGKTK